MPTEISDCFSNINAFTSSVPAVLLFALRYQLILVFFVFTMPPRISDGIGLQQHLITRSSTVALLLVLPMNPSGARFLMHSTFTFSESTLQPRPHSPACSSLPLTCTAPPYAHWCVLHTASANWVSE